MGVLECNSTAMGRLSDMGEDALIRRLVDQLEVDDKGVIVGPGDDCAVIDIGLPDDFQLLKTDSLVEGVHYLPETPAEKVGWKAVARVISDFAAMGGLPDQLLVTLAMQGSKSVAYMEELYRGMQLCASAYDASICGGETSSVPDSSAAVISVAGTGRVEKDRVVTRCGGKLGDSVLLTGKLGGSIHAKHLEFSPRLEEARWLTAHFPIHAMMDISDGLGRDLSRLALASDCGFELDESSLPINEGCDIEQAVGDGEDYELLLCVPPLIEEQLSAEWSKRFPELELTMVGRLTPRQPGAGPEIAGWQHFASKPST